MKSNLRSVKLIWYFLPLGMAVILYFAVRENKLDSMFYVFIDHLQHGDYTYTKAKPLNALFFLHAQPPLLTAVVYLATSISENFYAVVILVNCLCASLTSTIIYKICKGYASPIFAAVAALVYLISPAVLLYLAYPFYPTLTAFGYAILAYSFFLIKTNKNKSIYLFIFSILYLSLLRSSFTYLHGLLLLLIFYTQAYSLIPRKLKIQLIFGALFSLFLLPAKNYALYGFFGSSSWAPQNLALGLGVYVPPKVFPSPKEIRDEYPELSCRYSYDWIDSVDIIKRDQINYNSCFVLEFSRKHIPIILRDYEFSTHKKLIVENYLAYFRAPHDYFVLNAYNKSKLSELRKLYSKIFMMKTIAGNEVRISIILAFVFAAVMAVMRRDRFMASLLVVVGTHFLTAILTDGKESDRFVFDIESYFYIFTCATACWIGSLIYPVGRNLLIQASR